MKFCEAKVSVPMSQMNYLIIRDKVYLEIPVIEIKLP